MAPVWPLSSGAFRLIAVLGILAAPAAAAGQSRPAAALTGRVLDAASLEPVVQAQVTLEGTNLVSVTDTAGRYRLAPVPPGRQVLRAERIGYAAARVDIVVPTGRVSVQDIRMARRALEVEGITVTADPVGRARGELGTASVIGQDAIRVQVATSLAGLLELVPGMSLQPPGLDNVQQVSLRAAPTAGGSGDLSSFGTLIIMDGVPLSNNANLQTTGPRGETAIASSAGGGIDVRRIPASTLERVEVIRGVPSARYGDLTQGAIIVDTRAGEFDPELSARFDARTSEAAFAGGRRVTGSHTAAVTMDVARTRPSSSLTNNETYRVAAQVSHRARLGSIADALDGQDARLFLDTRIDVFQLYSDNPEDPVVAPGHVSWNQDRGIRLIERARLALGPGARLHVTAALDHTRQRSFAQAPKIRGAMPFTDRLTEGRATGRYIGGTYLAPVHLEGDPWLVYTRLEGELQGDLLDFGHEVRAGVEWRREWNDGSGYQFDIEFPPQVRFNGVQGFDRPRPFSAIPALATGAFYLDDRMSRPVLGEGLLNVQAGARLDLLHDRGHWFSGIRDALLQPRLNVELAPRQWLRLRGGIGTTAKLPNLGQLQPGPQYYDVVNVNRFSNDPAERLAVLTTFIRDPTNPDLGYARANKAEAGFELDLGHSASVGVVAFRDGVHGAVGISPEPRFLLRDIYELTDSVEGNGVPPRIIEPPVRADTVPILVDRPANNLRLLSEGLELTASFPEIPRLRTRVQVQGAWIRSEFHKDDIDFGHPFSDFQLDGRDPRTPYWEAITRLGERALLTYRLVHHQPELGLVVTATVQQTLKLDRHDMGGTDSLSWAGYLTRDGRLIPVPREERGQAQYRDLRVGRSGLSEPRPAPSDWFLNLQVSKTLPLDGRLSFYAFNALDRRGRFPTSTNNGLVFPPMRFGLELSAPAAVLERLVP